jgi:hypothetical protein
MVVARHASPLRVVADSGSGAGWGVNDALGERAVGMDRGGWSCRVGYKVR